MLCNLSKIVFIMVMALMKAYFLVGFVYLQEVIWRYAVMRLLQNSVIFGLLTASKSTNQFIGTVLYQLYYMLLFK